MHRFMVYGIEDVASLKNLLLNWNGIRSNVEWRKTSDTAFPKENVQLHVLDNKESNFGAVQIGRAHV